METAEQKKQVENLLLELNIESLRKSHNSVSISFALMLDQIDEIREPIPDGDIKLLLQTYRDMAERFYAQYESSLLQEIKKQSVVTQQVITAIGQLDMNKTDVDAMKTAKDLLAEDGNAAALEHETLIKNFPTLLQNALDKLKDEWQRLNTIAVANKTLTENKELIGALEIAVEVAGYSVGIEAKRIAVVPGNAFALYFFTYLENFAVLTVPIYSVRAPWEWSIFWHELAGYKVRKLEKDMIIPPDKFTFLPKNTVLSTEFGKKLQFVYEIYNNPEYADIRDVLLARMIRNGSVLTEDFKRNWIGSEKEKNEMANAINKRKNEFGQAYLRRLFFWDKENIKTRPRLDTSDFGNFEHQFERMLVKLELEEDENRHEIKAQGWCVDWFEELFEDAWSVLAMREPFLVYFEDILSRHTGVDGRHPPLDVRLSVAKALLKLADPKSTVDNDPKPVEKIAAEQILKFMSLVLAAAYNVKNQKREIFRYLLIEGVSEQITNYIGLWSTAFLKTSNRTNDAKTETVDFVKVLSGLKNSLIKLEPVSWLDTSDLENEENQIKASYEDLLKDKDHKQLLALSFFDIDFGGTTYYTFSFGGENYKITAVGLGNRTYISKSQLPGYSKVTINGETYYTNASQLATMKSNNLII